MGAILGGGKKQAAAAAAASARQRELQKVANDRQLSASAAEDQGSGATRRNPRGRRLFTTEAAQKSDLS